MKVGSADPEDDVMRARAIRETIGPDNVLMMDANQKWDVNVCVEINVWTLFLEPMADLVVGNYAGGDREYDEACRVQADVDRRAHEL